MSLTAVESAAGVSLGSKGESSHDDEDFGDGGYHEAFQEYCLYARKRCAPACMHAPLSAAIQTALRPAKLVCLVLHRQPGLPRTPITLGLV